MTPDKIIFLDFDGVIVDTFRIAYDLSLPYKPNMTTEEYRTMFEGNPYKAWDKEAIDPFPHDEKTVADDPFFRDYAPAIMKHRPVKGMKEAMEELSHEAMIIIMSSTLSPIIKKYLETIGASVFVAEVMGADVGIDKHAKMKAALKSYKIKPEQSVMITDTLGDIREADQAKVRSIAVSWGYHQRLKLEEGNPLAIVDTPQELVGQCKKYLL